MFEIQVLVRDRHGQAHNGGKIKPINSISTLPLLTTSVLPVPKNLILLYRLWLNKVQSIR